MTRLYDETYPKVLQLPLELGVPVVGVVAVPAAVEDRVVRREVGRVGAGLGTGGVLRQQAPLPESLSELLPSVVARITRLNDTNNLLVTTFRIRHLNLNDLQNLENLYIFEILYAFSQL